MPKPIFDVIPFSAENLADALSNNLMSPDQVRAKGHYAYFFEYLSSNGDSLNALTIVIEHKYISKSYLIDYSSYYSTCFSDYGRFCKRIHFFACSFSKKKFDNALKNPSARSNYIWNSYVGYIVIKPLPSIPIGATLLKTYNQTATNKRFFPCIKDYKINLFGKELHIDSLAFQEQDSVVGACASSALWSAFHKTSQLFQTPLPSPSDITKSAKNLFQISGRTFPNSGLDYYQIGNAIESIGLVSELRNSNEFTGMMDLNYLKAFIYAYSKMGLPVLLGIKILDIGNHLICVTGYKESSDAHYPRTEGMSMKASKIERLYAHDDQIGPFSKLGFASNGMIETSWIGKDGSHRAAKLMSVIIPIHNKIRLTFENIYAKIRWVDFYFSKRFANAEIYWDVYIDFSNEFKKSVRESVSIPESVKYSLLIDPLPKYIWIAKGFVNGECLIEFLFDATQIASANFCIKINTYNSSVKSLLSDDLSNDSIRNYFKEKLGLSFLKLLVISSK